MTTRWQQLPLISLVVAAGLTATLCLLPAGPLTGYDANLMHECYRHDFRAMVLQGEWPWWNPHVALGRPFFADVETAVLYPATWLVLPLGVTGGILATVWLHLVLALEGGRRLAAQCGLGPGLAWAVGLGYALSGAVLARLQTGQLQVFCVLCLLPWIWRAALRLQDEPGPRSVAHFALWLALGYVAGSPQILWHGLIPLAAVVAGRVTSWREGSRLLLAGIAGGVLAAALVAVQLLPFLELLQEGNRPAHDALFATLYGARGEDWLALLLPPGLLSSSNVEANFHVGLVVILAAGAALAYLPRERNVRGLAAGAALGLLLAAGNHTPLLPWLTDALPGFGALRYPSRYFLGSALPLILLAAWWLQRQRETHQLSRTALGGLLALQGVILVGGLGWQGRLYAVPPPPAHEQRIREDLAAEGMPRDGAWPRAALPRSLLRANAGAQAGVSTLTGFNNPALARTWHALYLLAGQPLPTFHRAEIRDELLPALHPWAACFSLSLTVDPSTGHVRFADPAGPRAYLTHQTLTVADWRAALRQIAAGHDYHRQALIESAAHALTPASGTPVGSAQIHQYRNQHLALTTESSAPALLVLAEPWYPGWVARVDGMPVAVVPANGWMRAVPVPAGRHEVVLDFHPRGLWPGLLLSLLGLGVVGLLLRRKPSHLVA
ncbi:Bacterial membrane protein YfhO [Lacunisphaera limnophila]|uniref:Bacterial membrane protein YfhO n=1 Tax=Lacunisphaera limnophila TaxID=1838286 RepID=A0A1D8AUJ3_9BACT|nr:YfhO family protein [Lacunisphaera limnophila]AOS44540.1 Bacterial membrane protein YfhO [Lacunisphaera limnophila]